MKTAVYPGSFDPLTQGHLDIIKRASFFFDKVYILLAESFEKKPLFTLEERQNLLKESLAEEGIEGVEVLSSSGLTVDFMKTHKVDCIVRGVRSSVDFRAEQTLANINSKLYVDCETVLFCSRPEFRDVSSSVVKEVAKHGGDLTMFVPKCVEKKLKEKFDRS